MHRFIVLTALLTVTPAFASEVVFDVTCDQSRTPMTVERMYVMDRMIRIEGQTVETQVSDFPVPYEDSRIDVLSGEYMEYTELGIKMADGKVEHVWSPEQQAKLSEARQQVEREKASRSSIDSLVDLIRPSKTMSPARQNHRSLQTEKQFAVTSFPARFAKAFVEFEQAQGCQAIAANLTAKETVRLTCKSATVNATTLLNVLPDSARLAFQTLRQAQVQTYQGVQRPARLGTVTACDLRSKIGQPL